MLARGLEELGHEARPFYLGATMPGTAAQSRADLAGRGAQPAADRLGDDVLGREPGRRLLGLRATARELARRARTGRRPWEVLNAQEVYSIPHLRPVADEYGLPLVLTLHGYPLYESVSEGYSTASRMGLHYLMRAEMRALRLADAIVTVDTRLYRHALGLVPERADSVYTLMNFVDTSAFAPSDDPAEEERPPARTAGSRGRSPRTRSCCSAPAGW